MKVLEAYGPKCSFCGESRYELLCVDHVAGNGAEHKKTREFARYGGMFRLLAALSTLPDPRYRILCYNCNCARGFYGVEPGGLEYKSIEEWKTFAAFKQNRMFKLNPESVADIRERHKTGASLDSLSSLYQVDLSHISRIVRRRVWKNVA